MSPDSTLLALGSKESTLILYEIDSGNILNALIGMQWA